MTAARIAVIGARRREVRPFSAMLAAFVLLGAPTAALAVAWPDMAAEFGRSLGGLGVLSAAFGGGYTASTLAAGVLARWAGTVVRLAVSIGAASVVLAVIAGAEAWAVLVVATFLLGVTGGQVDAGVNAYVTLHRGVASMGLIHGSYGFGVALAPLLIVVLAAQGLSWRIGFLVLAGAEAAIAIAFLAAMRSVPSDARSTIHGGIGSGRPRRGGLMSLSVTAFLLYGGLAMATGAWAYTELTEHQSVAGTVAGVAVAGYWAGLTLSRLLLGVIERHVRLQRLPGLAVAGAVVSLLVFWLAPQPWLAMVGLVASGLAHGPYFPTETLMTAGRFGVGRAPTVVGFQIAAATFGGAVIAGGIGLLVARVGLGAVGPALVAVAVVLAVVTEALHRSTPLVAEEVVHAA